MSAKKTKAEKLESRREWYKKNKAKEILKQFDDGLIITSKIDNSGARLQ